MNEKASCITINCGCCGNGDSGITSTPVTGDGTPIGTVIAYMGTKAPIHYLVCDGTVLNREDFPALAQQIQDEFGLLDYFGGDGIDTFAVPNLRNEFLRGYHGDAVEQVSGEIGQHQDATQMPRLYLANEQGYVGLYGDSSNTFSNEINFDKYHTSVGATVRTACTGTKGPTSDTYDSFSARPTNVAVLYCIKYE